MEKELFDFFEKYEFPEVPKKETNYFDTAIHNMYENPFTEILSFILDNDSPYENRDEFFKLFIYKLTGDKNICVSMENHIDIDTQHYTNTGKKIDMIITNKDYVIVLENKIGGEPQNPFDEYKKEINRLYPNRKRHFFLYTFKISAKIDNWTNVLIGDVFSYIKDNITFLCTNKWDYFVKDFLSHYIEEMTNMNKDDFNACEKNFSKFIKGNDFLDSFINEIIQKLTTIVSKEKIIIGEKWDSGIPIRIIPFKNVNIVLLLTNWNKYSLQLYYDKGSDKDLFDIKSLVKESEYIFFRESKPWPIAFRREKEKQFTKFEDAFNEIIIQLSNMKKIYNRQ